MARTTFLYATIDGVGTLTVRAPGNVKAKPGETVGLRFADQRMHLFGADRMAIRH